MGSMINWRNISVSATGLLAVCGMAAGQAFTADFEAPAYNGSAAGTPTTDTTLGGSGQQGWYLPNVAGSQIHNVYTYTGNALGLGVNPQGSAQFDGGEGNATGPARAQHPVNFSAGGQWEAVFDCTGRWDTNVAAVAVNNLGSWSMQPSGTARYFQQLMSWGGAGNNYQGPNSPPPDRTTTPTMFHIHFGYFTAASPTVIAFAVPGPEFLDLNTTHWYRVKSRWDFTAAQILNVSIQDLTAATAPVSYDVTSLGWYLQGGPNSTFPLPTDVRCFAGGNGDITGWDNLNIHPFVAQTCYANCDGSTGSVFLTINDFVCFQSAFAAGTSYANCDGSTSLPVLTINDFVCFQSAFAAGCSAP